MAPPPWGPPMTTRPPWIARILLGLATEKGDRRWLLAGLDEEFASLAACDIGRARRWYWRQALTSLPPLITRRLERRPTPLRPVRTAVLNGLRSDLRQALRATVRTKAVTAAILLTMALGIGATAAVSIVVWKVMLRPLPLPQP